MNPFVFPAIGLDLSDESFKFARLENGKTGYELGFFGSHDLKAGIIEEGEIKDGVALTNVLREALAPYRRRFPYVMLSLPEEKGYVRLIKIQKIPEDEVHKVLEFQIEEHIPYPPSELVFDYKILPRFESSPEEMSLVITAYPKVLVESYIDAVRSAGFITVVLELESQAIARATAPRGTSEAVLVGDIGRTRTTFSIVYRGQVLFASTIKFGGRDIDTLLMSALHITADEARDIKVGRGFDSSSEDLVRTLAPALSTLTGEANRQIAFWYQRRSVSIPAISRIYLCGGDAHMKGLPEYISREVNVPCELAHIGENIFNLAQYVPSISAHEALRYATALGLALHSDAELFR